MSAIQIVRVLVRNQNNAYHMHHLTIPTGETNASIISRIRELSIEKRGCGFIQDAQSIFTMNKVLFGKARVLEVSHYLQLHPNAL
jgi:hypothetical protein